MKLSKTTLIIIGLYCIMIFVALFHSITQINRLSEIEKEGVWLTAQIVKTDVGTQKFTIQYKVNDVSYEKTMRVSREVFREYRNSKTISIKLIKQYPKFITWKGDILVQKSITMILIEMSFGTVFLIMFIVGISLSRRKADRSKIDIIT